jgi:uncharacterized protein (DUF58 family)
VRAFIEPIPASQAPLYSGNSAAEMYDILVARDLLHDRAELLRSLERQGVRVLDTVPERLTIDAVSRYLSLKTGIQL